MVHQTWMCVCVLCTVGGEDLPSRNSRPHDNLTKEYSHHICLDKVRVHYTLAILTTHWIMFPHQNLQRNVWVQSLVLWRSLTHKPLDQTLSGDWTLPQAMKSKLQLYLWIRYCEEEGFLFIIREQQFIIPHIIVMSDLTCYNVLWGGKPDILRCKVQ